MVHRRRQPGLILAVLVAALGATFPARADLAAGIEAYVNGDAARAGRHFQQAAGSGDTHAQFITGYMFLRGDAGLAIDQGQAAWWLERAAKGGQVWAQTLLGLLFLEGEGVGRNEREAARWLREAANRDHPWAQAMLGTLYLEGKGVSPDPRRALEWLYVADARMSFLPPVLPASLDRHLPRAVFAPLFDKTPQIRETTIVNQRQAEARLAPHQIAEIRRAALTWIPPYPEGTVPVGSALPPATVAAAQASAPTAPAKPVAAPPAASATVASMPGGTWTNPDAPTKPAAGGSPLWTQPNFTGGTPQETASVPMESDLPPATQIGADADAARVWTNPNPVPPQATAPPTQLSTRVTAAPTATTSPPSAEPAAESVLAAQSLLFALGYDPVPLDGKIGSATTQAVLRFQRDRGLRASGIVTPGLIEELAKSVRQIRFSD